MSNDNGFFEFKDVEPGTAYHVAISAEGFANWTSPTVILRPGQYAILTGSKLHIAEALTTITVASPVATPEEIATEQVKVEEHQRVFGIFPNFYVVYDHNAAPLTTKLKFKLASKVAFDPVTIIGVGVLAGINQAGNVPNYDQGLKGYGERYGATFTDGFTDIMIGGAILPSLLHQDPRYFYQGTGTKKSRALHALSSPFICKGDNGQRQPNYSTMGGDLAAAAISTAYYPASNRGPGMVFGNALINTGERALANLAQEFILRRLTPKGKKSKLTDRKATKPALLRGALRLYSRSMSDGKNLHVHRDGDELLTSFSVATEGDSFGEATIRTISGLFAQESSR